MLRDAGSSAVREFAELVCRLGYKLVCVGSYHNWADEVPLKLCSEVRKSGLGVEVIECPVGLEACLGELTYLGEGVDLVVVDAGLADSQEVAEDRFVEVRLSDLIEGTAVSTHRLPLSMTLGYLVTEGIVRRYRIFAILFTPEELRDVGDAGGLKVVEEVIKELKSLCVKNP